jgi:TIR domain
MDGIFISYRRDDSAGYAGRLYDRLIPHFGAHRVFMDVEGIELGADFVTAIEEAVGSCRVLIVIIGDEWLKTTDAAGRRRLEDPHDFIRLETVTALKRGIRVVPVLVGGAFMPRSDELPDDLKPLARRQAIEISHKQWEATTAELIKALESMLSNGSPHEPAPRPLTTPSPLAAPSPPDTVRRPGRTAAVAGVALCAAVGGMWALWGGREDNDDSKRATTDTLLTAQVNPDGRSGPAAAPPTPAPPDTVVAVAAPPVAPAPAAATRPAATAPARVPPPAASAALEPPAAGPPPAAPAPTIRVFQSHADPAGARLCYSVTNAEQLTLSPLPGELAPAAPVAKDCVTVGITETTTFTLTARNAVTAVRKSLTVSPRPVAAVTPAPIPAPAVSPEAARPVESAAGTPRVGESWTYRTSGKWPTSPKRNIVIAVQSVTNGVVTDGLRAEGMAADVRRSTGAQPMFMSWNEIGTEFSPYLAAYNDMNSLGTLRGFATPDVGAYWTQWHSEGKVIGQETVSVPAGSFQAHKVEVWSNRRATGGPTQAGIEPVRIHYLIWYAPSAKRYVKMQRRVISASGAENERDVFELVARH